MIELGGWRLAKGLSRMSRCALWASIAALGLLAGCGGGGAPSGSSSTPPPATPAFKGQMRSGENAVTGAVISIFAAGSTGPGAGAQALLASQSVSTDGTGHFEIPVFQCPSGTAQIYLVGQGGTATSTAGAVNPEMTMMAALGDCSSLSTSTFVVINEATTAAAAWALSQFIGPGAAVGASASNGLGLRNAFLTAANLVDTSQGSAPGPSLPANTVLEVAKLNTLADILWTCNQATIASACSNLMSEATAGGAAPSDTFDAALNIVRNPASNVSAIFALLGSVPFQPVLTAAPHDWTLSATFGNCASGCGGLNLPGSLALDSMGNVWVANYFGGAASKFSSTGAPAAAGGYSAAGLHESFGIAVDGQDSVWITNENGAPGGGNPAGSVVHLSSSGANLSGSGYTGGGIYYPIAVAAASGGDIWVADHANSTASLLASNGTAISGSAGYATSALPFTTAVAVDANQNGWFAYEGGVASVTPAGAVTQFPCCNVPAGIAIDQASNIWIADYEASAVVKLSSSGAILGEAKQSGGVETPVGIAVDGAGNIWTANYRANTLSEFNGSTLQPVSASTGFGLDAHLYGPFGVAIDPSGDLWISNAYGNTLTELIGAARPVKTPLLGPPVQP